MAKVELIHIEKSFGDVRVVKDVSLSIHSGEFLVLVGPSGCGKSTCLRMIAGLEDPGAGELRIGERRVNEVSPKDRNIGMVFQSYALYPHMTVAQNMGFGLSIRKTPKDEAAKKVAEVAAMLGLSDLLARRPKELSGGQRQRVAIGRAICRNPDVFLFDEPLSNLDAALRVQMRAELADLHRRLDATMVYVTHDQVEAMTLADRIAVLEGGVLQQVGTPLELFHRPANRFVAGFIGTPTMNFLEGELRNEDGAVCFAQRGLEKPIAVPGEHGGQPVTLGIRPQDVVLGGSTLKGVVEAVEQLGWEAFIFVRAGQQRVVARAEGQAAAAYKVGDEVGLDFPGEYLHLFAEDGTSLRQDKPLAAVEKLAKGA